MFFGAAVVDGRSTRSKGFGPAKRGVPKKTDAMGKDKTKLYSERRGTDRVPVRFDVNCRYDQTYLFSRASNLSEFGIFLVTSSPAKVGTEVDLNFSAGNSSEPSFEVRARVVWVDRDDDGAEAGMGLQFVEVGPETGKRIRALIRTVAYLD